MITIQYLEPGPHIKKITPQAARDHLRAACDVLQFDSLLLGWDLPTALVEMCREETAQAGIKLYRWHPLLTGDGFIDPEVEWRTRNWRGNPLSGFRGLPEFTFVCPNHPAARAAILAHLGDLARSGLYDGLFLDRMRFPSPAENPVEALACFCPHCHQAAATSGLDLAEIRRILLDIAPRQMLRAFGGIAVSPLSAFLDFRQQTITQFVSDAVAILCSADLAVGLDCFSPSLTRLVGQDLNALAPLADWTKLMIYGHARGPATLPFELGALARWLVADGFLTEAQALNALSEVLGLALPASFQSGLPSAALAAEYQHGRQWAEGNLLLAGIELVEIPGVSELAPLQLEADLRAFRQADAHGLALSWDLWHMPLERLAQVRAAWLST